MITFLHNLTMCQMKWWIWHLKLWQATLLHNGKMLKLLTTHWVWIVVHSLYFWRKKYYVWIPTFLAMLLILNWKIYFDPKIDLLLPELDDFRSFEPISEAFSSIRCIGKDKKFNEGVLGSEAPVIVSIGFLSCLLLRNTS